LKKVLRAVLVLAGAGYVAWKYWQTSNQDAAAVWAAETDRIG